MNPAPDVVVPYPVPMSAPSPRRGPAVLATAVICAGLGALLSAFRWGVSQEVPRGGPSHRVDLDLRWADLPEFHPSPGDPSGAPGGGGDSLRNLPSLSDVKVVAREAAPDPDLSPVPALPSAASVPAPPPQPPPSLGAGGGAGGGQGGGSGTANGPGTGTVPGKTLRRVDPRLLLVRSEQPHYYAPGKVAPQGVVWLRITVDAQGVPLRGEPVSGDPILFEASLKSVLKWRWDSPLDHGHPAPFTFLVGVDFHRDR